MKIYALNINESITQPLFDTLLSVVSDERRRKINKFVRKEDSDRALASDILLRNALIEDFGVQNKDILFIHNAYEKPSLVNTPHIYFNISHSGSWVVCAINDYEIGIDIEKIENIDLDIAKSFFSTKEYTDLMKKVPSKRIEYFYDLWTLKESYIKACGRGLSLDLSSFSIGIEKDHIILESKNNFKNYLFNQYSIDKNYKLSVCASGGIFPEEIIFKTLENLHLNKLLT